MIVTAPKKQHFYLRDGSPLFEVPNASNPGTMRPSNIADARKADAVPSVTTVLRIIAKEAVNVWEKNNLILAAMTLPDADWTPRSGESMNDVAKRIVGEAENLRDSAADTGTAIHALCETWCKARVETEDPNLAPLMAPWYRWAEENVEEVIATEKRVVGEYGGTIDAIIRHKKHGLVIVDWKSQRIKNGKAVFYPEWIEQLAAYHDLYYWSTEDGPDLGVMSVVIGSTTPHVEERLWTHKEGQDGLLVFQAAFAIWKVRNNWRTAA